MPKQSGAQPRNKNALKQGYYSREIPPDMEWRLLNPDADSLENEITAIRILMSSLAAAEKDPELKDPDAPYKMILLATRRLNIILAINADLQDPLPVLAQNTRELRAHSKQASGLYTIQNLDKAASLMLDEKYTPMAEYLPPELLKRYQYILARQRLADDVSEEDDINDQDWDQEE